MIPCGQITPGRKKIRFGVRFLLGAAYDANSTTPRTGVIVNATTKLHSHRGLSSG
ncbi:MAG TPA: hypothetical protein VKX41_22475 [Alloacidobacterium sp.]|nr:hypothetical protein [Alloacidobacterium sp.]